MKFGKRLEVETVPEWKIKYIDYKGLKKKLRAVRKEKLTKEKEFHKNKKGADNSRPHSAIVEIHPQPLHNYHLNNVKKFPEKRLPVNNDRTFSLQSRTFSMNSVAESVHDFLHKISSALAQKNPSNDQIPAPAPITSLETLKDEVEPEERFFFTTLNGELKKVDKFYKVKEKESLNHFDLLIQQYEILKNMNDEKKKSVFYSETWAKNIVRQSLDYFRPSVSEEERRLIDYKTAKKNIKKAIFELYRGVELLRTYQTLNYTGFVKILKKYDKISGRNGSNIYTSELKGHHFVTSDVVSKLLNSIEDFYAKTLEGGSRIQAVRKLRVPNNINKTYYSSALLVGLYLGLALPTLIYSIHSLMIKREQEEEFYKIWNTTIYIGLILPIVLLLLIGVNMYIWIRLRINYKFIFELNPRDNLDFRQYLELPSIIFLGLSYFIFLYSLHIESTIYPMISVIFIGAVLFNPFPIFYYNARRWFIFSAVRLLGSGFIRVEFRDFFFADELNSLAYSFVILQLFGCVPSVSESSEKAATICYTKTKSIIFSSVLGSIPALMRLFQCWKRYRDTDQINHMINIGKYGSTVAATCSSAIYRISYKYGSKSDNLRWAWVIIQFISSIYTFTWDIKVDWSLLELNSVNFLLRDKLGCKYNWLYYYAIISNFLLRCSWILIIIKPNDSVVVFIVAFGEMIRRWQWNFIRVENEHVNNCGQFRAIKDIPLPFPLQTDNDIIAPDNITDDVDKDFARKSSSSFNSFTLFSKRLFKKRKARRNSVQSSNDWKDFESKQDSIEYNMYTDIYEESDDDDDLRENDTYENITSRGYESDTTYTTAYNAYASRRLPTIFDQEDKGKQPAFQEFRE